jgi:peroxiredoxin
VFSLYDYWFIQTLDHALVGRHSKPKKNYPGVWFPFSFIFCCLLGVKIFLFMIRPIVSVFAILFLLYCCSPKPKETVEQKPGVNDLPFMSATLLDGETVDLRQLPGNTIIILFFPDCDHCQREATAIQEKLNSFKKYELYFLSSNGDAEILRFSKDYKLNDLPNVKFGRVDGAKVYQTFGAIPTPSVYIYSSERKLIKQFNGETNVEEIIKFL